MLAIILVISSVFLLLFADGETTSPSDDLDKISLSESSQSAVEIIDDSGVRMSGQRLLFIKAR